MCTGVEVGFVIPLEGSENEFIIGAAKKLAVLTWNGTSADSTHLQILEEVETDLPGNRFNDAKADASGRVRAGETFLFLPATGFEHRFTR